MWVKGELVVPRLVEVETDYREELSYEERKQFVKKLDKMVRMKTLTTDRRKYFPQLVAGLGTTMIMMQVGFSSGWSSPYLVKLTAKNSSLPLSLDQASWVASLINFGRIPGAILSAILLHYVGGKQSLLFALLPMSASWLLIMLAQSAAWLYLARFCDGLSLGVIYSSGPFYLGEVALPKIRGSLISLSTCGITAGIMLGNVAGSYLDMQVSAAVYLGLCLALIALFCWLPESPHHLVKVEQFDKAKKSVEWYNAGYQTEAELEAVKKFVMSANSESFGEKLAELRKPALLRATILVIAVWIFMQICGVNIVLLYTEMILIEAKSRLIEPAIVVIYASASAMIASIVSIMLIDRFGRRFLLIVSSLGVSIAMVSLGAHFVLIERDIDVKNLQWLPVVSIFLFEISFFVGLMCVPGTMLSELFPANVKSIAACMAVLAGAIFASIVTKTYQPLIGLIGQSNVYFTYGVISFLVVPYFLIYMPETKGKTLQQIQDKLLKR